MEYKLYTVKEIRRRDAPTLKFFLDSDMCPKTHIKENFDYLELDLKTIKEQEFPMGELYVNNLGSKHAIFYDRKLMVFYDDEGIVDYPEDLTWERDIYFLIEAARRLERIKLMMEK